jgi:hypothetical protein
MNLLKKLNSKQKILIMIVIGLILVSLIIWQSYGGEIWTKTQVLVEIKDEVFDTTYKEWKDQFVLGLEYTLLFDGIVGTLGLISVFLFRTKS